MPRQKPSIPYNDQVTLIPKVAAEDTTLTVSNAVGGSTTFPVPSGTEIELDVAGLHYNRTLIVRCLSGGQFLIVSQRSTGRILINSCQSGSLVTGRRMHLFHSVKVCILLTATLFMTQTTSQVPALASEDGANGHGEIDDNVFMCFSRFGETEVMVVINMFVSRYQLEVREEPEFAGETFEERFARVTAFDEGLSTL